MEANRVPPDNDLPYFFGIYEFSVVPRLFFTADGSLPHANDKSSIIRDIVQQLREHQSDSKEVFNGTNNSKVAVFDGMKVVNETDIKKLG